MALPRPIRHAPSPDHQAREISSTSRCGRKANSRASAPRTSARKAASSASPVSRESGSWDTQKWLIGKHHAHIEHGRLIADTEDARQVIEQLGSASAPHQRGPLRGEAAPQRAGEGQADTGAEPGPVARTSRRPRPPATRTTDPLRQSAQGKRSRRRSALGLLFSASSIAMASWISVTRRWASPFAGPTSRSRSHTSKTSRFFAGLRLVAARTCCGDSRSPDSIRRRCAVPGSRGVRPLA